MSRESELDEIMGDLIKKMVHEGDWTDEDKRTYELALRERSRRLHNLDNYRKSKR